MEKEIIKNNAENICQENSLSDEKTNDTKAYKYDLLCIVNGKKQRLSYDEGCYKEIVGIFPFNGSNVYLHTIETEITTRLGVNEQKVPSVEFWKSIFEIKDSLNTTLANLNLALLNGSYYATSSYISHANWIVSFKKGCDTLKTDYFGSAATAKIRYFGKFE